jgi:dihydrofolate reductase
MEITLRRITFGGATSLDNYLARPDGAIDWLLWSDEVAEVTSGYMKNVDTVLMGRKTYDFARRMTKGKSKKTPGVTTYVFSRTLKPDSDPNATIVAEGAAELVRQLKQRDGKEICLMGGGDLAKTLFEADLIDEVGFNVHPVILGAGIPAFHPMNRQIDLELMSARPFKNGCVLITYRVKR